MLFGLDVVVCADRKRMSVLFS